MKRLSFRAMGCRILVLLDSSAAAADKLLAEVPSWFEEWESHLSPVREVSELSRLKRTPGEILPISGTLLDNLRLAAEAERWSGGLVTYTLPGALPGAAAVESYNRAFEHVGTATMTLTRPMRLQDTLVLDVQRGTACLGEGVRLNLGGMASGWAGEQTAERLLEYGPVLVDAGGDIFVSGPMLDGQRWPVGVGDPAEPGETLELLLISKGAVATSGKQDGPGQHHIIDPHMGGSCLETDVVSATVIAPTAWEAETAARAAFMLGVVEGVDWIEDRPRLAGMLVLEDGSIVRSRRLREYTWS